MRRTLHIAAAAVALAQGGPVVAKEGGAGPAFVPMQEIVVPIVDGARVYGRLRVKLVLLAHDAAAMPTIQKQLPELREAALIAAAEFARLYASPFAPVDAGRLASTLSSALRARDQQHAVDRILVVGVSAERD